MDRMGCGKWSRARKRCGGLAAARKGFIFTLDALMAVLVLMAFAGALFFLSSKIQKDNFSPVVLLRQADDALSVLDRSGGLAGRNMTTINSSLSQLIPSNTGWNLSVSYYNYTGQFVLVQNFTLGQDYTSANATASASRVFYAYVNSTSRYYGIARLSLWTE